MAAFHLNVSEALVHSRPVETPSLTTTDLDGPSSLHYESSRTSRPDAAVEYGLRELCWPDKC